VSLLPLLALTGAALAGPAPGPAPPDLRAELAAACRLPDPRRDSLTDIDIVDYAGMLASDRPSRFCRRRDQGLALRLTRFIAEAPSSASGGAYALLAVFYEGAHGMKRDPALAQLYRRRAWLLGSEPTPLFKTPEEARAYLTDAGSIAFLRERIARGAPPKERVRLAEALLARRRPEDRSEAWAVLKAPETAGERQARLLMAKTALESEATPAEVAEAAARLRPVAPFPWGGADARSLILRLARLQLVQARTTEEKWDGVQSLAAAAYAAEPEPLRAFLEALLAANGGLEPAAVDAAAPPPRILGDDYPSLAMRKGISGQIRLRALVDPRGRIIFTESAQPGQPAALVDAVRRVYASRPVAPLAIPVPRPTPYVWVRVPPVNFQMSE
jgi:hypothetical protein